jgi:hypothetical protein
LIRRGLLTYQGEVASSAPFLLNWVGSKLDSKNLDPKRPNLNPTQKKMQTTENQLFALINGGELGIRTPGPVTVNSFQDCRNRPLCQLSGAKVRVELF